MSKPTDPKPGSIADPGRTVFGRVVVGTDGSPEALEAVRQGARLEAVGGELTVVAAWSVPPPLVGPMGAAPYTPDDEPLRSQAAELADQACEHIHIGAAASPHRQVVRGLAWQALVDQAEQNQTTLIAVGSHGQGRAVGIVIGSTTTEVIHKAPCSVLVARQAGDDFPRKIVVGVDGSPQSADAYAAARYLADRFGAELWPVVAHGGKDIDKQLVSQILDHRHEDLPDEPVRALVAAAADADLIVVGSRHLLGIGALGSVSERVAHQAHCSTLVVRVPTRQPGEGRAV